MLFHCLWWNSRYIQTFPLTRSSHLHIANLGNQPDGEISVTRTPRRLPGYGRTSVGTIQITYAFPDGIQDVSSFLIRVFQIDLSIPLRTNIPIPVFPIMEQFVKRFYPTILKVKKCWNYSNVLLNFVKHLPLVNHELLAVIMLSHGTIFIIKQVLLVEWKSKTDILVSYHISKYPIDCFVYSSFGYPDHTYLSR